MRACVRSAGEGGGGSERLGWREEWVAGKEDAVWSMGWFGLECGCICTCGVVWCGVVWYWYYTRDRRKKSYTSSQADGVPTQGMGDLGFQEWAL